MEGQETTAVDAFMAATADVPETLATAAPNGPAAQSATSTPELSLTTMITPQMVSTIVAFPFEMMAMKTGKGGEFWHLSQFEKGSLGDAWQPVIVWLFQKWGLSEQGPLTMAVILTMMSLTPRLAQERTRRASLTDTTRTGNSGASPVSSDQPAAVSPTNQTDLFETQGDPYGSYPLA